MSTGESYKRLYKCLRESEFSCVPAGFQETEDVYELVRETYPSLCEQNIQCGDVCGTDNNQPEWKHRVRSAQQDLVRDSESRIKRLSKGWYYEPLSVDIEAVPGEGDFKIGKRYNRWELHDVFGGQRYTGIATPAEQPFVFIFTGESGKEYGYEDEFLPNDTFLYTGEGAEGNMTMEGGNKAIREHRKENEEIHLFEDTEYPWIVSYVGQFEYAGHRWETLEDKQEHKREAIRFELEPAGGAEIEIESGTPSSLSEEELFKKAKQSAPIITRSSSGGSKASGSRSYPRSEVVKEFALRHADGVCQGCEEKAPFVDTSGDPFLEIHHLHRRADGGPDAPENVIALCPNCHRRRHHGRNGDEFNQRLIEKAEERNQKFF
jgi:5-methylcytosine-specific restriction protein A